jgi:hypothetical protein
MQGVFTHQPVSAATIWALDLGAELEPGNVARPTRVPHREAAQGLECSLDGLDCVHGMRPNGSRLSCGRNDRWRKDAESLIALDREATQFLPTCERPAASSAC